MEKSQLTFYNLQNDPVSIVIIAIGLAGTENSPYFVDLVNNLDKKFMIIGVRGFETSSHSTDYKLFLKNDCSRIFRVMGWVYTMYPNKPKIGIGISIGGALILRHQSLNKYPFDKVIMASTSLWYEHAVKTMPETFTGFLANKVLTWWQFECLYFGSNYLTTIKHPTILQWIRLLLANNLLQQDRVLCELYGINYKEYINDLDMRWMTHKVKNVNYLISTKDPMFSKSHLKITIDALKGSMFNYKIVKFGGHGDFTINKRNDYLVNYCNNVIKRARL